jgi:uncharacterized protein (TIGR00251 family)
MIVLVDHAEGLVLQVHAHAGARKCGVKGEHAGALKLAVTAPPEHGRANEALMQTLREALRLRRSQVELLHGKASRNKHFLIRGLTRAELEARLRSVSGETESSRGEAE